MKSTILCCNTISSGFFVYCIFIVVYYEFNRDRWARLSRIFGNLELVPTIVSDIAKIKWHISVHSALIKSSSVYKVKKKINQRISDRPSSHKIHVQVAVYDMYKIAKTSNSKSHNCFNIKITSFAQSYEVLWNWHLTIPIYIWYIRLSNTSLEMTFIDGINGVWSKFTIKSFRFKRGPARFV